MNNSPSGTEVLNHLGCEHLGTIRGEGDGNSKDSNIGAEYFEELFTCVSVQFEDR